MLTKAIQTNPSDARPADRRGAQVADLAAVAAEDFVPALGKCMRLSVPNVARTLRCPSVPVATGPYIAATASASSAQAAPAAGHIIDIRVGGSGRFYA